MSYVWENKITDYYYTNPELDTVDVLWTDEEDVTREHYIKIDETDEQWRDFITEVPYEYINARTEARHDDHRELFKLAFRNYAARPDVNLLPAPGEDEPPIVVDSDKVPLHRTIFDFMTRFDNTDAELKEELFKLKLKIFEEETVKNSKSADKFKNAKTFIRKAENPIDVLLGYMVFTAGAELEIAETEKFEVLGVHLPTK